MLVGGYQGTHLQEHILLSGMSADQILDEQIHFYCWQWSAPKGKCPQNWLLVGGYQRMHLQEHILLSGMSADQLLDEQITVMCWRCWWRPVRVDWKSWSSGQRPDHRLSHDGVNLSQAARSEMRRWTNSLKSSSLGPDSGCEISKIWNYTTEYALSDGIWVSVILFVWIFEVRQIFLKKSQFHHC